MHVRLHIVKHGFPKIESRKLVVCALHRKMSAKRVIVMCPQNLRYFVLLKDLPSIIVFIASVKFVILNEVVGSVGNKLLSFGEGFAQWCFESLKIGE